MPLETVRLTADLEDLSPELCCSISLVNKDIVDLAVQFDPITCVPKIVWTYDIEQLVLFLYLSFS